MAKTLGYLITWTMYGTWLQGDERGYVRNARIYSGNTALMQANKHSLLQDVVKLSDAQQYVVREAIMKEAELHGQHIYALAVKPYHVHIVAGYITEPIGKVVAYYKKAARLALNSVGLKGKVWTRGYDKRFCFDQATLKQKIEYVENHNK